MKSTLAARPRVRVAPEAPDSDGADAGYLASRYGLTPDDWQADVLTDWLARRPNGRWAAKRCGLAVPRQNGKNAVLEIRELYGMAVLGEKFLHTAHEVKTARKAFLRIASFFEQPRRYPELANLVRSIRRTNGQEAVELTNGGGVEFVARSSGSGRGFSVDVLVLDEAQDLTEEELAALKPTISSGPARNSQTILTGTPPPPSGDMGRGNPHKGEVFRAMRADGEHGSPRNLAWTDFGAPDGPMPDIEDRAAWYVHNPALGDRLDVEEVETELTLIPGKFARERLGWWGDPEADQSVIDPAMWEALRDRDVAAPGRAVLVLDVSPDRKWSSIGVAGRASDRTVVLVYSKPGIAWVAPMVTDLVASRDIAEVALFPRGQAGALIPSLVEAEIDHERLSTQQLGASCAMFQEAVKEGRIVHTGQGQLDVAVANARTRYMGEAEVWDRRDPDGVDISPLVACAAAAYRWGVLDEPGPVTFHRPSKLPPARRTPAVAGVPDQITIG